MKNIKYLIITFVLFLSLSFNVKANEVSSVKLDVYINKDGSANVTETWNATLTQGTEGYHAFHNLGNSSIDFISVGDDRGVNYSKKNWNINDSFDSKKNQFGEYRDGDELDLCWGISEYGSRVYTLKYNISNFIYNTSDGYQIIYWTFFPENNGGIGDVLVNVRSDQVFSDDLDVWGYGKYGAPCYVKDGIITHTSDGYLNNDEYLTLLAKFDGGTFNTTNSIDKSFDEMLSMAEEGADHYTSSDDNDSFFDNVMEFFAYFFEVIFFGVIFLITGIIASSKDKYVNFKKVKNAPPFRDLPLGDDYMMAYFYAKQYNLVKNKNDILGAVLLKLIKDDCISFDENAKKGEESIKLLKEPIDNLSLDLYKMLNSASVNGSLTSKQFKKYCTNHYTKLFNWVDSIYEDKRDELVTNNFILKEEKRKLFVKRYVYSATDQVNEIGERMGGLRNFFKDFTSLNEKRPIEVKLWRDYLIYAQLMGMAKKVAKEFKELYPELETDPSFNNGYYMIDRVVYFSNTSVSAAQSAHQAAASSYSGGGGGFSSGGGGGGSFGGGGGGGAGFR